MALYGFVFVCFKGVAGCRWLGVRAVRAGCCVAFARWWGFGWLMFDEVFGASMALYGFDFFVLRGWGGSVDG